MPSILEELNYLQNKLASVKEVAEKYPDTVLSKYEEFELYLSTSANQDVDTIKFVSGGINGYNITAYCYKKIGDINLHSNPEKFDIFCHFPMDLHLELIIYDYSAEMEMSNIPSSIIKECDLFVLKYLKDNYIDLNKTNINHLNKNATINKLLILL